MKVGLISSGYAPDVDGIGDYTWWMAKTLAAHREVETPVAVFTRTGSDHKISAGVAVSPFFDARHPRTFSNLPETLKGRNLDWLVLQYNPFGWGRRGYCPRVPSTLHKLRRSQAAPRLAVMFHETTVPPWPWKFTVMLMWQWPILRSVCRAVDVAFVSTDRWVPQVKRVAPRLPVHVLPVGSNIPLCDISQEEARLKIGIESDALVLGVFGSAHMSRRLDWIAAAINEARRRRPERKTMLLYVGPDGEAIRRAVGDADLIDCGVLPSEEVGARLRAMDAAISPFIDGMSARRTSVISVLHHGIPVATTQVSWTEALFREATPAGLLVSKATSAETFAMETADWLDQLPAGEVPDSRVVEFHDENFSWPGIADTMVRHLC